MILIGWGLFCSCSPPAMQLCLPVLWGACKKLLCHFWIIFADGRKCRRQKETDRRLDSKSKQTRRYLVDDHEQRYSAPRCYPLALIVILTQYGLCCWSNTARESRYYIFLYQVDENTSERCSVPLLLHYYKTTWILVGWTVDFISGHTC